MGREGLVAGVQFFLKIHQELCLPIANVFLVDFPETQCATSKTTGEVAGKFCLPGNAGFL